MSKQITWVETTKVRGWNKELRDKKDTIKKKYLAWENQTRKVDLIERKQKDNST